MNKEEFESIHTIDQPILILNKNIGFRNIGAMLKLLTIDSDGEVLEVKEIYGDERKFHVRYENIDLLHHNKKKEEKS